MPESWIVDLARMTVDVYTEPTPHVYASVQTLRDGDVLRPTLLPEVAIRVVDIPR